MLVYEMDRVKALPFVFYQKNLADGGLNTPVLNGDKGLLVLGLLGGREGQTGRSRGVQVTGGDGRTRVSRQQRRCRGGTDEGINTELLNLLLQVLCWRSKRGGGGGFGGCGFDENRTVEGQVQILNLGHLVLRLVRVTQWGGTRRGDHSSRSIGSVFVGGHLEVVLLGIDRQLGMLTKISPQHRSILQNRRVVMKGKASSLGVIDGAVDDKDAVEGFDGGEEADFSKGFGLGAEGVKG